MMYKLTVKFEIPVVANSPNEAMELFKGIDHEIFVEEGYRIHCEPCFDIRDIPKDWLDLWPYGEFNKPCRLYFEEEET